VDADDTLWLDSKYFRKLQGVFLELSSLERKFSNQDKLNQALAMNPGEHGYASALFNMAVENGFGQKALFKLEKEIKSFLSHPIEVLPYVSE
jgi:hypothetical protein